VSDAFRLEVFVDKDGTVYDEVILDKVGDDTNKWDYLLDSKLHHINNLPSWMRRKLAVLKMRSYDSEGDTDGDDAREESKTRSSEATEEYG
jgi:hypothetical protein